MARNVNGKPAESEAQNNRSNKTYLLT